MPQFPASLLTSGLLLALWGGAAQAQSTGKPLLTLQMPALPDPVRVTLKPATTALLMLDYVDPTCTSQPKCKGEMLRAVTPFLAQARKAGVIVAYGTREQNMSKWLPEVAPAPNDIKIANVAQDRFYNTDLDKALKAKGITTIVVAGWKVSGSVVYSSVGATARGYTAVIPVDTTTAATDYETAIGFYQLLNQNPANFGNEPLKANSVTLSRTDMVAFQ